MSYWLFSDTKSDTGSCGTLFKVCKYVCAVKYFFFRSYDVILVTYNVITNILAGFFISQLYTFALFLTFSYVQHQPDLFSAFGFTYTVSANFLCSFDSGSCSGGDGGSGSSSDSSRSSGSIGGDGSSSSGSSSSGSSSGSGSSIGSSSSSGSSSSVSSSSSGSSGGSGSSSSSSSGGSSS